MKSNGSWDVLPALIAHNQPLDKPHNGDDKMDNNDDDMNNDDSFVDPLLVNIIIDPPAPNLNNEDSYDSMVENSDASLPFNNVVGHKNNPDMPREWDVIEKKTTMTKYRTVAILSNGRRMHRRPKVMH